MAKEPLLTENRDGALRRPAKGTPRDVDLTFERVAAPTSGLESGVADIAPRSRRDASPWERRPKVSEAVSRHSPRSLLPLAFVLALGAALRLGLLLSPFGEVEADEAIIGLMARHVLAGEWPVFYWGQAYLGSLEAYVAAAFFAVFGPTIPVLKSVPAIFSLLFIALVYLTTRTAFGSGPALLAALYLALPPSFFGIWSIKVRGGYVEMLALGQLVFLLVLLVERERRRWTARWAAALGFLAGITFWTNVLSVVYLAPAGALLLLRRRHELLRSASAVLIASGVVGAWPLIWYNLTNDFATWRQLFSGSFRIATLAHQLAEQVRYSGPILVGLAQASTAPDLFAADFAARPGRWIVVPLALGLLAAIAALVFRGSLLRSLKPGGPIEDLAVAQVLLLVAANLVATSATRFGELATEPRYLMPVYSAVPLFALLAWRLRRHGQIVFGCVVLVAFAINVYSLVTADPRLNLPSNIGPTTAATRAALARFLEERDLNYVYTDYWIGYPLALQSEERIVPSITSGGFNRYIPYAHAVSVATNPAFVFVAERPEEVVFRERLADVGASAQRDVVSIYAVYHRIEPPTALPALRERLTP